MIGTGLSFLVMRFLVVPPPLFALLWGPKSVRAQILTAAVAFFAAMTAGFIAWFRKKKSKGSEQKGSQKDAAPASGSDELEMLLASAEHRLSNSKSCPGKKFSDLPLMFVIGAQGSTKTTSVLRSGIEPELLGGHVFHDGDVTPTGLANLWLAQNRVFVEAGASLQADPARWKRLIAKMQPGRLRSAFDRSPESARAAIVCVDCEAFSKAGASQAATNAARDMRNRLEGISQTLGITFPVYVLFTKLDRISFFQDFVRNLDRKEASQVLGATLPGVQLADGVYSEAETARLNAAFDGLVASLAERRPEFLIRERDTAKSAAIYEFPREFRKLRSPVVQFLVELCRPSQLTISPFLRGFYFCGVRPVVVEEEIAAESAPERFANGQSEIVDAGASRMFRPGEDLGLRAPRAAAAGPRFSTRRVPEWTFLRDFFCRVLLEDEGALAASKPNVRTQKLRRVLLVCGAALCLLLSVLFTVSFLRNRSLIKQITDAANATQGDRGVSGLPSRDALLHLDALRRVTVRLADDERNGAPWMMRWGLYSGSGLHEAVYKLYFDRFGTLLFKNTQGDMHTLLARLPANPAPKADYNVPYQTLKAYLETTSNNDRATLDFLPAALQDRWQAGRNVDPERLKLARTQFDFYTTELALKNPYSSEADAAAIANARAYLKNLGGSARVYQSMLADANKVNRPLVFNQVYPTSAEVVVNVRPMQGAYTKPGFAFMQTAISSPEKYVGGEEWVLGKVAKEAVDSAKLQKEVKELYYADYIAQWRDYLRKSSFVKYKSLGDAAARLTLTARADSPLLELLWMAMENTSTDMPDVSKAFKPLQKLMSGASAEQYIVTANATYMTGLNVLLGTLEEAVKLPPEQLEAAAQKVQIAAGDALRTTRAVELGLGIDTEGHIEKDLSRILEEPITNLNVSKGESERLNAAGSALCGEWKSGLSSRYPFQSSANMKATVQDLDAIFRPEKGALWVFYEKNLKKLIRKEGGNWGPIPGAKPEVTQRFVRFFGNAAAFSDALYANGTSQEPKLVFALKPQYVPELKAVSLKIDGQDIVIPSGSGQKQIIWPNNGVQMTADDKWSYGNYGGLWGIFEFFWDANKPVPNPEWLLTSGKGGRPIVFPGTNIPVTVRFELDMLGKPQVFRAGYFQNLSCVSEVAK